jgi:phosphate uptake regulator
MAQTTRKLNQVRNSFYVYLPRRWCDEFKLTKDSEVVIERALDGTLNITPTSKRRTTSEPLKLSLTKDQSKDIVNLLVGSYIVGTNELELHFEDLDMATRGEISKWIRRLPGFEILEEHSNSFILSDTSEKQFITPILRRQFATTKYMLNGLLNSIETGDTSNLTGIIDRDEDVDRHRYFVERLCHIVLRDPAYAKKIAISPPDALSFSLAAKYVERIADHVCAALNELVYLKKPSMKIIKISRNIFRIFDETKITSYCADIVEIGINRIIESGL